jgi:hypothetical protein
MEEAASRPFDLVTDETQLLISRAEDVPERAISLVRFPRLPGPDLIIRRCPTTT